jgi:hypothetical protein
MNNDENESVLSGGDPRHIYQNLRVELFDGSPDDTMTFTGLSSDTTVRSFRAVIAARLATAWEHVRVMAYGEFLDDDSKYGSGSRIRILLMVTAATLGDSGILDVSEEQYTPY